MGIFRHGSPETTGGATTSEGAISTSVEAAGAVGGEAGLGLKEVEKEEGLERVTVGGAYRGDRRELPRG